MKIILNDNFGNFVKDIVIDIYDGTGEKNKEIQLTYNEFYGISRAAEREDAKNELSDYLLGCDEVVCGINADNILGDENAMEKVVDNIIKEWANACTSDCIYNAIESYAKAS